MRNKIISGSNAMRFGVAVKLAVGFAIILTLLVFMAVQSVGKFNSASKTVDELVSISSGVLQESNTIQKALLWAIADFKRISEKDKLEDIDGILK